MFVIDPLLKFRRFASKVAQIKNVLALEVKPWRIWKNSGMQKWLFRRAREGEETVLIYSHHPRFWPAFLTCNKTAPVSETGHLLHLNYHIKDRKNYVMYVKVDCWYQIVYHFPFISELLSWCFQC